jgi:hypothetical protein
MRFSILLLLALFITVFAGCKKQDESVTPKIPRTHGGAITLITVNQICGTYLVSGQCALGNEDNSIVSTGMDTIMISKCSDTSVLVLLNGSNWYGSIEWDNPINHSASPSSYYPESYQLGGGFSVWGGVFTYFPMRHIDSIYFMAAGQTGCGATTWLNLSGIKIQ